MDSSTVDELYQQLIVASEHGYDMRDLGQSMAQRLRDAGAVNPQGAGRSGGMTTANEVVEEYLYHARAATQALERAQAIIDQLMRGDDEAVLRLVARLLALALPSDLQQRASQR